MISPTAARVDPGREQKSLNLKVSRCMGIIPGDEVWMHGWTVPRCRPVAAAEVSWRGKSESERQHECVSELTA